MSTVWLNDLSSANLLRKTYISGFLDISGGDMNLRSGNFFTGGTITQNTDSANVDVPSYSMFSVTDLSYMFASITQPMTTFAQDITTNGNTVVKKNLFVTNDASLNSRLFLGGDASLNSRLFLGGDASMNSKLFLRGDALLNSKLVLVGDASLNSKLLVGGDVSLNSKLFLAGDALLNSKLTVAGDALLNSKLTVAGDVSLNSKLRVAGDASLNSKLSVTGDALLNSKLVLAGDLSLNGNLRLRNNCVFYSNSLLIKSPTPNNNDNCFINITSSTDTGESAQNIVLGVSGAVFYKQAIINTYKDGVSAIVPLSLQVDSVEKIRIESTKTILTGNVGIDTSSPTVSLDVSGAISTNNVINLTYTTAPTFGTNSLGYLISNTLSGLTINNTLTTISTINLTIGVYIITFNIGNGIWTGTIYFEASIYDAAGTELCKSAATGISGASYAACVGTLIYSAAATTSVTLRTKLTSGTNNMTASKGVFQAIRIA